MIESFLRAPWGVAAWAADGLRVLGVLSVLFAAVTASPSDAGVLAFSLPALMAPRFLGVRAGIDLACGVVVLVAAWSNVVDFYRTMPGWDLLVHFTCTGVLALICFVGLERLGVVPVERQPRARTPLVLLPAIGLALSALWEMVEWVGYTFLSDQIFVTYSDTIGDMVAGGFGAAAAGILASRLRLID